MTSDGGSTGRNGHDGHPPGRAAGLPGAGGPSRNGHGPGSRLVTLGRSPGGQLRLTLPGDRSYLRVKAVQASPLTHPGRYISFLDEKGAEISLIRDLEELDPVSRELAREALRRYYVVARILSVRSLRVEMGIAYWSVETDRGERDFALKDPQENVQLLDGRRIALTDVHGNRYEIPDLRQLDQRSRTLVESIL